MPDEARPLSPELQHQLADDSPGTPLGRLAALSKWAEERCGHDPASGKPAETVILEYAEMMEDELDKTAAILGDALGGRAGKCSDLARAVAEKVAEARKALDCIPFDLMWTCGEPYRVTFSKSAFEALRSAHIDAAREAEHGS